MVEQWKKFLQQKYAEYEKIGRVECPAFNSESIYFTEVGFRHLLRKNRKIRDKSEQIRRMTLFQFAPGIIRRALAPVTYFVTKNEKGTEVRQWSLQARVNGMKMTVIVEQINSNPKHFLSIFNETLL